MTWVPLKRVADVWPSNVDKLTVDGEHPVRLVNYTDVYYGDRMHPGLDLMAATATADEFAKFRLQRGDVILTKDSETADDIGVSAYVEEAGPDMVCGYHLSLVRPRAAFGRYLHYAISSTHARRQMSVAATGVTRFGLRAESVGSLSVWVPSEAEQRAIADYLDAETVRIDALIAKKHQLIHLLEEWIESLVFRGVSGQLTSADAPQRDSGIDWLGPIPAHFGTPTLGANFTTQLGKMLNAEAAAGPDQVPYIKNTNVKWDSFDLSDLPTMSFGAEDRIRCELRAGDLLVCEGGEVGRSAIWPGSDEPIFFQKALHRVRPLRDGNTRFLMYCLWAAASLDVFSVEGNQATIVHLTGEKLREHRFPSPPAPEQEEIVQLLDEGRRRIASLQLRLTRQLELLAEHRQALITAAVTGEFAVPGVA